MDPYHNHEARKQTLFTSDRPLFTSDRFLFTSDRPLFTLIVKGDINRRFSDKHRSAGGKQKPELKITLIEDNQQSKIGRARAVVTPIIRR